MACAGDEPFELDSKGSVDNVDVLRVALGTDGDAYAWLAQYSEETNTSWIVDWEIPNPTRYVVRSSAVFIYFFFGYAFITAAVAGKSS